MDSAGRIIVSLPYVDERSDPLSWVMLIKIVGHTNHTPGDKKHIGNMPLSLGIRNFIADRIRDGLDVQAVSRLFKERSSDLQKAIRHGRPGSGKFTLHFQGIRDSLATRDDIYNIWRQVVKGSQILHNNVSRSLELCHAKLLRSGCFTCAIDQEESDENGLGQMIG
ncbi:hypothetical protein BGX28_005780, partial [Mortierella sp. GBA30]